MRGGLVVLTAALVAAPGSAHAGRTFYGWLYGTEVMPERGVELQSWLTEENKQDSAEDSWLLDPLVGITDQLEIGFPIEFLWERTEPAMAGDPPKVIDRFNRFGVEARYRFVTQDPVDAPAVVPLVRVGIDRLIADRGAVRPSADVVLSYETGIVHVVADVGFYAELGASGGDTYELRPGAGVSFLAVEQADLRFGAEVYSEVKLKNGDDSW
ncbi:MAG TPA: hypothetical protein VIV40_32715, partial [Kofleriaceae bacterium]